MMGKYGFFSLFAILTLYDITAITVFGKPCPAACPEE